MVDLLSGFHSHYSERGRYRPRFILGRNWAGYAGLVAQ